MLFWFSLSSFFFSPKLRELNSKPSQYFQSWPFNKTTLHTNPVVSFPSPTLIVLLCVESPSSSYYSSTCNIDFHLPHLLSHSPNGHFGLQPHGIIGKCQTYHALLLLAFAQATLSCLIIHSLHSSLDSSSHFLPNYTKISALLHISLMKSQCGMLKKRPLKSARFESWLYHFLAVWVWASYLTSECPFFFFFYL